MCYCNVRFQTVHALGSGIASSHFIFAGGNLTRSRGVILKGGDGRDNIGDLVRRYAMCVVEIGNAREPNASSFCITQFSKDSIIQYTDDEINLGYDELLESIANEWMHFFRNLRKRV